MGQLSKIRFALILPVAIIVAGCTAGLQDKQVGCYPENPEFTVICDNVRGYTYKQPSWIRGVDLKEREANVSTYDYPLTGDEREQLKDVYYGEIPSSTSCSPEFIGEPPVTALGVMKPTIEKDEEGNIRVWGKVDYWGPYGHGYALEPEPICSPGYGEGAGYAFCSQKDEKAVTICISQQTDDPELAEEIFKSFRWTE